MKYQCPDCKWRTEKHDEYPKDVFERSIEVHKNHLCGKADWLKKDLSDTKINHN